MAEEVQTAYERYQQAFFEYEIGVRWMRIAVPVVLTDKQAAKARREVRQYIREQGEQK